MKHQTNILKARDIINQLELTAVANGIAKYKDTLAIHYFDFKHKYCKINGNIKLPKSQAIIEIAASLTITQLAISKFRELAYLAMNNAKALGRPIGVATYGDLEFQFDKRYRKPITFLLKSNPKQIVGLTYNEVIKHLEDLVELL